MKREYFPEPKRDQEPPRWWQESTVEKFTVKIGSMNDRDVHALAAEIRGTITLVQSQLESRGKTDITWWRKARAALGFMAEKSRIVKAENARRNERARLGGARTRVLRMIQAKARDGDVREAVAELIDYFLGNGPRLDDEGPAVAGEEAEGDGV